MIKRKRCRTSIFQLWFDGMYGMHFSKPPVARHVLHHLLFAGVLFIAAASQTNVSAQKANLHADIDNLIVRHKTEHYALAGTISDARLLDYGRCLEYIYQEYARGFAKLTSNDGRKFHAEDASQTNEEKKDGQSSPVSGNFGDRFPVIIFANRDEYELFGAKYFPATLEHTRGVFLRSLKLLVIRDDSDSSQTYEALFHEAFHQFAHRFTPFIPTWANEGLATYYGHARPTTSGLRFDKPASSHFKVVQEARVAKALIPLEELMVMNQARFYEREKIANLDLTHKTLCYAQAYTLVTYILSDPAGVSRMRSYLKELAEATTRSEANSISRRYFDAQMLEAVTPQWLTYCQKF
jgi:hypothetical protein